jgi:7-cyano-7-deazaguanine synthase
MSLTSHNVIRPAIVLLSGGLDSMVTAALAKEQGFSVHALSIDYGQRHARELEAAKQIASALSVTKHTQLRIDMRKIGGSALTDEFDVPKDGVGAEIPITYVPARNLVFLSICVAVAEASAAKDVFIGVNALDYSGYPDCRPDFISSFAKTATLGTKSGANGNPFRIHAPLQDLTKADIAKECFRLGLDPSWSWSCYDPTQDDKACGLCDSCRLRRKGFAESGIADSTLYAV